MAGPPRFSAIGQERQLQAVRADPGLFQRVSFSSLVPPPPHPQPRAQPPPHSTPPRGGAVSCSLEAGSSFVQHSFLVGECSWGSRQERAATFREWLRWEFSIESFKTLGSCPLRSLRALSWGFVRAGSVRTAAISGFVGQRSHLHSLPGSSLSNPSPEVWSLLSRMVSARLEPATHPTSLI